MGFGFVNFGNLGFGFAISVAGFLGFEFVKIRLKTTQNFTRNFQNYCFIER